MRTGQVEINGATFNPLAPFGGYKQSGHGPRARRVRARGVPRDQGDLAVARDDLYTVVLRPFLVYGPGQPENRLIPRVLRAARDGGTISLTREGRRAMGVCG